MLALAWDDSKEVQVATFNTAHATRLLIRQLGAKFLLGFCKRGEEVRRGPEDLEERKKTEEN